MRRFLSPLSVAVVGGGTWCEAVVRQCRATGYTGEIWPVHPTKAIIGGLRTYPSLAALPGIPDAAFIGVNRDATVQVAGELSAMGCGGAVCFAAGYREAIAELSDGAELQEKLVAAAGPMRILGPNCYGFVNALDRVSLWPDLHGLVPVARGVAIVGQSSNVLINMTMQRRGLPIATVVAAGNQAQLTMAGLGAALLEDPRITALGLHVEGLTDLPAFTALAARAFELRKPVIVLKVGRSEQAQQAAISHTASLAGSHAGAGALFARLGMAQVDSPEEMMEALKIAHVTGGLKSARIMSASCSGGEASLMADLGLAKGVEFPVLVPEQTEALRTALGPKVALANPLDYNTYIWDNEPALVEVFGAMMRNDLAMGSIVLDLPRADRFDAPSYEKVVRAVISVAQSTDKPMAVLSLLHEGLPEAVCERLIAAGVVPLCGMANSLAAIRALAGIGRMPPGAVLLPGSGFHGAGRVIGEAEAKRLLMAAGVPVPRSISAATPAEAGAAAAELGGMVVLKGAGIAHKTEAGAVVLSLRDPAAVIHAAEAMMARGFLVEEMITGTVVELLVGVLRDVAHGFILTIGLGGVLTELMRDTVSLVVPASPKDVGVALESLKIAPLLSGYRGKPGASVDHVVAAIMAVQHFVTAHAETLDEIEINPLIATVNSAIAADALIRMVEEE